MSYAPQNSVDTHVIAPREHEMPLQLHGGVAWLNQVARLVRAPAPALANSSTRNGRSGIAQPVAAIGTPVTHVDVHAGEVAGNTAVSDAGTAPDS